MTLLGCEEPRVYTPPLRPLTPKTSLGFAVVQFAEQVLRIRLHPWQKWFFIHALELLPDGTPRFRTLILLVARQNGKTLLMQILALFFMYVRGVSLVIGTAQNLDIAEEVWQGAVDIAEAVEELAAEVANVDRTNGKKALELTGKQRYKVQAANRRGGRSLSGDFVLMDELREHQTFDAWGAISKTTMARPHAIVMCASNAGDLKSVVLGRLRLMAHLALGDPDGFARFWPNEGDDEEIELVDESIGIFEWSMTPGLARSDPRGWCQANPSLGYSITERAIRNALSTDTETVFRTEVGCQWVLKDEPLWQLFEEASWRAGYVTASPAWLEGPFTYAVEVTEDRDRYTIVTAGLHGSRVGVECGLFDSFDEDAALARIVTLHRKGWKACGIDAHSPAATLIRPLKELHGIEVHEVSTADCATASQSLWDAHRADLAHSDQDPALDAAFAAARKRTYPSGWLLDRRIPTALPARGAAIARWLHLEIEEPPGQVIF